MEHIGIDLGSKTSHVCVRDAGAVIQKECAIGTQLLAARLEDRKPARVVLETCNEAFAVADAVSAVGHDVWVVPANLVRQLGVGNRGVKNDVRDAQALSKASVALGDELPRVHVPSRESRQRQKLLTHRTALVRARTQLVNGVKSHIRGELLPLPKAKPYLLPAHLREWLEGEDELRTIIEPTLQSIEQLTASIAMLDAELKRRTQTDPQVQRLKTMPGVGAVTAVAFMAGVDEWKRFPNAAHLASYLGLTPGENTTGGKQRFTGITKAGKGWVRTLLIQAAWSLVRTAPDSALAATYHELTKRRPKQVAIVAVARKMVRVLYAMLRDGVPFDPRITGAPSEEMRTLQATLRAPAQPPTETAVA